MVASLSKPPPQQPGERTNRASKAGRAGPIRPRKNRRTPTARIGKPKKAPGKTAPGNGDRGSGGDGEESEDAGSQVGDADLLAGLSSSVSSCEESPDEQCIRDFVVQVAPESRYVGGRVDLSPQDDETNTEVIYFEDPGLESCEFERAEHEAEGRRYAVILLGEGSFSDERGDQCIPQV